MDTRLAWLATLLCLGAVRASDTHPCPCIPAHLCPHVFGESPLDQQVTGPMEPCEDSENVHCCGTSVSKQEHQPAEMIMIISEHLKKERQIMAGIDDFLEKMSGNTQLNSSKTGGQRKEKSISNTSKNKIDCDKKQCNDLVATTSKKGEATNRSDNLTDISNIENVQLDNVKSLQNGKNTSEQLFLVYAENPQKNKEFHDENPVIVLPTKDAMDEFLLNRDILSQGSHENQSLETLPEHLVTSSTEAKPDDKNPVNKNKFLVNHYDHQSHLHKLLPKRHPFTSFTLQASQEMFKEESKETGDAQGAASDFDEIGFDEVDEAGSEVEEVMTAGSSGLSPILPEQANDHKQPFRSPPRHLTHQPVKNEEPLHIRQMNKNVYELLRGQSKGRTGLAALKHSEESTKDGQSVPMQDRVDEINIKVINDIMKNNFTGRPSFLKRPTSVIRSHTLPTTANKVMPESIHQLVAETSTTLDQKHKKSEGDSEQNTEHDVKSSVGESRGGRFPMRGRSHFRSQSTKLPPKFSTTVSMSQEQAFDTSKESPRTQELLRRRQSYRRSRVKSQSSTLSSEDQTNTSQAIQTSNSDDTAMQEQQKSTKSTSGRRSRFRPRSRFGSANPTRNSESTEEPKATPPTETKITNTPQSAQPSDVQTGSTDTKLVEDESSHPKSEGDLDSSATDEEPQEFTPQGRFLPPAEMETGFKPMLTSRDLKIVGPIPGGFLDQSTNADEIGLDLPETEFRSEFNTGDQFDSDDMSLTLLPPVFPVPQPPTSTSSSRVLENETPSLLPPVETPSLLPPVETRSLLPPLETPSFMSPFQTPVSLDTMLDQHKELTRVEQEFTVLKGKYDMLLNRYAQTLNLYNDKYKKLLLSASTPILRM